VYPVVASLTWELIYEVDAPSVNDQITTSFGGVFLGEVLHRLAMLVVAPSASGRPPGWLEYLAAFLLEPMGEANRWLFDHRLGRREALERLPPFFLMLSAGATFGTRFRENADLTIVQGVMANLQGLMIYGMPGDPEFRAGAPFSHFALDFNLSFPGRQAVTAFFMRGLLVGDQFGVGPVHSTRGLFGLFGQYDFSAAGLVRVSSVAVGPGTSLQARLRDDVVLQLSAVLGGIPFGTVGSLGLDEALARDYHIGAGFQTTLDARVIHTQYGWFRVTARQWFIAGVWTPPTGWEFLTYLSAEPRIRLAGPIALGAEFSLALRRSYFADDTFDRAVNVATVHVTLSWMNDATFGVVTGR
jgi:hypothetical protein